MGDFVVSLQSFPLHTTAILLIILAKVAVTEILSLSKFHENSCPFRESDY